MELDKEQDKRYSEEDGIYEYDDGNICIISPRPITPEMIDATMKDSERSFIERIRENPNIIADYCGETPLEDYLSEKKFACERQEKEEIL